MTPSATVAESRLSMAPRMAMVNAGATRPLIVSHDNSGTTASGSSDEMLKRSPMVSMVVMPAYCFSSSTTMVITMMAISEPGMRLLNLGVVAMMAMLASPTPVLQGSMWVRFWK